MVCLRSEHNKGFIWIIEFMGVSDGLISKILISFWIFKLQVTAKKSITVLQILKF